MWSPSVLFGTVLFLQSLRYYYSIFFSEKIKDLLPQGSIDEKTKLVLVNAIYLKGNWEEKFLKSDTRDEQFKLNKVRFLDFAELKYFEIKSEEFWRLSIDAWQTQTKPVKMMNQTEEFPLSFIPEMDSQVLELPYVGKNLSMLIILPNEIQDETTGLQKVRQQRLYFIQIFIPYFKKNEAPKRFFLQWSLRRAIFWFPKEPFSEQILK